MNNREIDIICPITLIKDLGATISADAWINEEGKEKVLHGIKLSVQALQRGGFIEYNPSLIDNPKPIEKQLDLPLEPVR